MFQTVGAAKLKSRLLKFVVWGRISKDYGLPNRDCETACMGLEG